MAVRAYSSYSTPSAGGDKVDKLKPGDRIWVKNPCMDAERKIGTVMAIKKTRNGVRYYVEWEVNLVESPNHHPGYRATEIVPINPGSPS